MKYQSGKEFCTIPGIRINLPHVNQHEVNTIKPFIKVNAFSKRQEEKT